MTEHVIVRQNSNFDTEFRAPDPSDSESDELKSVVHIHELTPYTMLLASVGACTAIVLHTYAQNHDVALQEVELDLKYKRDIQQNSEISDNIERYEEEIEEELTFTGDLTEEEHMKLFQVAKQCSIHKMLEDGIKISSQLLEETEK